MSTPKKKTAKYIKPEGIKPESLRNWEDYFDLHTWSMKPVCDASLDVMAKDLVEWSKKNDIENDKEAFNFVDYLNERGIQPMTFDRWKDRHEGLKQAWLYALRAIGSRRERGAAKRKYDANVIYKTQAHYDPIYKEQEEWRANLRATEVAKTNAQPTVVVIERYPETDIVPKRKEKS